MYVCIFEFKTNAGLFFFFQFTNMIEVEMSVCSKSFLSKKYHRMEMQILMFALFLFAYPITNPHFSLRPQKSSNFENDQLGL